MLHICFHSQKSTVNRLRLSRPDATLSVWWSFPLAYNSASYPVPITRKRIVCNGVLPKEYSKYWQRKS